MFLQFPGIAAPEQWFAQENFIQSTFWEKSQLNAARMFKLSAEHGLEISGIEIEETDTTFQEDHNGYEDHEDDLCEETGFLKLTCDPNPKCDHLKWWSLDERLKGLPCGLLYSKTKDATSFKTAIWASKIQIFSSGQPEWKKIFKIGSFRGLEPIPFLLEGYPKNFTLGNDATGLYRYKSNFESKLQNAKFVKLEILSQDRTNVVSELIFRGGRGLEEWFTKENLVSSSLWNLESVEFEEENSNDPLFSVFDMIRSEGTSGDFHINMRHVALHLAKQYSFLVWESIHECASARGWLFVVSTDGDAEPGMFKLE